MVIFLAAYMKSFKYVVSVPLLVRYITVYEATIPIFLLMIHPGIFAPLADFSLPGL